MYYVHRSRLQTHTSTLHMERDSPGQAPCNTSYFIEHKLTLSLPHTSVPLVHTNSWSELIRRYYSHISALPCLSGFIKVEHRVLVCSFHTTYTQPSHLPKPISAAYLYYKLTEGTGGTSLWIRKKKKLQIPFHSPYLFLFPKDMTTK